MKISKFGIVVMAVASLIACGSGVRAQDNKDSKDAPKGEGRPPGGPGGQRLGDFVKQRLERLTEELKLTDAQKPKVEAALKEQAEKMQGVRDLPQDQRREKAQAAREAFNKKMKDILDKEQYEKFEKMAQQRGPGGQGGRRGGPGGPGAEKKPEGEKKADNKK